MALSERQQAIYLHLVDVYIPLDPVLGTDNVSGDTDIYPPTPNYSNVQCYRETKLEITNTAAPGRSLENNIFTMDMFHFDLAQEMGSEFALYFKTPGHPDFGTWFKVVGQPTVKSILANAIEVVTKRSNKPQGVE